MVMCSSSRRTRQVSKDIKRLSLEEAELFICDQVTSAIKSCMNSRAYGPDSLSIFHLKNLCHLAIEHLTSLYDSLMFHRLPSIWKIPLVIPIYSQARQGLIAVHLVPTHLDAMPSGQGPLGAHLNLYQRIYFTS